MAARSVGLGGVFRTAVRRWDEKGREEREGKEGKGYRYSPSVRAQELLTVAEGCNFHIGFCLCLRTHCSKDVNSLCVI